LGRTSKLGKAAPRGAEMRPEASSAAQRGELGGPARPLSLGQRLGLASWESGALLGRLLEAERRLERSLVARKLKRRRVASLEQPETVAEGVFKWARVFLSACECVCVCVKKSAQRGGKVSRVSRVSKVSKLAQGKYECHSAVRQCCFGAVCARLCQSACTRFSTRFSTRVPAGPAGTQLVHGTDGALVLVSGAHWPPTGRPDELVDGRN